MVYVVEAGAPEQLPIVIVGAGAAGLVAAIFAAAGPRPVLLLESTRDGGRKILISGGGRCNILPSIVDPSRFVTASSRRALQRILDAWPLADQRRFFEERAGVRLALEPETGKLFPASNSARHVRDALVSLARRMGVEIRFGVRVVDLLAPGGAGHRWTVTTQSGTTLFASRVILASGGLSVPATGSDGAGLDIAARLGHALHRTYAALTPLVADPPVHAGLSGVSVVARLRSSGSSGTMTTEGGFLFTHRGYSGPAVLDISHLAVRSRLAGTRQPILVEWGAWDADAWNRYLRDRRGSLGAAIRRRLPVRLADTLLAEASVEGNRSLAELRREDRLRAVATLGRYRLAWTSDEGYKKAEVTGGGVALGEVFPHTLESRRHPGLFLCGEMLDAFGPIGGYNFLWAWVTGRLAGTAAAQP
jgi:hypothetical protein